MCLPAIGDSLGEDAQVLVDLHAVVDLQDIILFILEESQRVPEDHLNTQVTSEFTPADCQATLLVPLC